MNKINDFMKNVTAKIKARGPVKSLFSTTLGDILAICKPGKEPSLRI